MIVTYKYRVKGRRAERLLRKHARAVNQVWNFCVATHKETLSRYKKGSRTNWLIHFDFCNLISGAATELGVNAQTAQAVCKKFVKNRNTWKVCPRYRSSYGSKRSLGWIPFQKQSRQITSTSLKYLGQVYRFFGAKNRPLPWHAKGGCFVEDAAGRWYVCFHVETVESEKTGTRRIGIDLGLKHLAVTSDGEKIEAVRSYREYEDKLVIAQRARNKKRASRLNVKIRNIRQDYLHKVSARLVRTCSFIAVGNVSSSKLARTHMAKPVLDVSWSAFRDMLAYKASRHRATFVVVDESFSTQTCSSCGDRSSAGRPKGIAGLGIRVWECDCGAVHDRDVNAAKNILRLGLSAQPRGDESHSSTDKHETRIKA